MQTETWYVLIFIHWVSSRHIQSDVGHLTSQAMDSNGLIDSNFKDNRAVPF